MCAPLCSGAHKHVLGYAGQEEDALFFGKTPWERSILHVVTHIFHLGHAVTHSFYGAHAMTHVFSCPPRML